MTQMRKLRLKFWILLVSMLVLSCQKDLYDDEFQPERKQLKTDLFKLSDLEFHHPDAFVTYSKLNRTKIKRGSLAKDMYGFEVDTSRILYLEKMDGYKSFTFHIKEIDDAQKYLDNLIITIDPDGKTDVYHSRYDLNKAINEIQEQAIKDEIKDFTLSKISIINYDYANEICVEWGYWDAAPACGDNFGGVEEAPRCYNEDGTIRYIPIFIIMQADCYGGGGGIDFGGPNPGPPPSGPTGPPEGIGEGTGETGGDSTGNPTTDESAGDDNDTDSEINTSPWVGGNGPDDSPCDELNKLAASPGPNIVPSINALKAHVLGPNKIEKGNEYRRSIEESSGDTIYTVTPVQGTNDRIEITAHRKVFAAAHTHPFNGHPIPSFGDLVVLRDLYTEVFPSMRNKVTFILVARVNSVSSKTYAIRVSNFNLLIQKINEVLAKPEYEGLNDQEKIDREIKREGRLNDKSSNLEKTFLQRIAGFGVTFHVAGNDSLTDWKKLILENDEVVEGPCN